MRHMPSVWCLVMQEGFILTVLSLYVSCTLQDVAACGNKSRWQQLQLLCLCKVLPFLREFCTVLRIRFVLIFSGHFQLWKLKQFAPLSKRHAMKGMREGGGRFIFPPHHYLHVGGRRSGRFIPERYWHTFDEKLDGTRSGRNSERSVACRFWDMRLILWRQLITYNCWKSFWETALFLKSSRKLCLLGWL